MSSRLADTNTVQFSAALRRELCLRNQWFAKKYALRSQESFGSVPVLVYEPDDDGRHGNFLDQSYVAIRSNPGWRRRLEKVHPQGRASLPKMERRWCELDSCTSSDALLMNVFCYPGTLRLTSVRLLLGLSDDSEAEFGIRARVPLASGAGDRTEVDMRVSDLLVEAKLTESDFQKRSKIVVEAYRDFRTVFERKLLPQTTDEYFRYQLIRNVLAAFATGCSFSVLLDARRPDLREQLYGVLSAVKHAQMRVRCKVLTWQELCEVLPKKLQTFMDEKYGIVPPGQVASPIPWLDTEY